MSSVGHVVLVGCPAAASPPSRRCWHSGWGGGCVDVDAEVERSLQMSCATVFHELGEARFRSRGAEGRGGSAHVA